MPIVFSFLVIVIVVLFAVWFWVVVLFAASLWDFDPGAAQQRATDWKEQCIMLKHERNAEKFLDLECDRLVRYKQDK